VPLPCRRLSSFTIFRTCPHSAPHHHMHCRFTFKATHRGVCRTPADEAIGRYSAELIKDGDCLQLGIGAVPDSVRSFLKGTTDLGIHTEMFSDGVVDLVNRDMITGARKNFDSGMGGQADFVHGVSCSRGGRSTPAFHSTAVDGTVSRIAPHLDAGTTVCTNRADVHCIVTEDPMAGLGSPASRRYTATVVQLCIDCGCLRPARRPAQGSHLRR